MKRSDVKLGRVFTNEKELRLVVAIQPHTFDEALGELVDRVVYLRPDQQYRRTTKRAFARWASRMVSEAPADFEQHINPEVEEAGDE